eukprot:1207444-Prymnesium_polylepis.1
MRRARRAPGWQSLIRRAPAHPPRARPAAAARAPCGSRHSQPPHRLSPAWRRTASLAAGRSLQQRRHDPTTAKAVSVHGGAAGAAPRRARQPPRSKRTRASCRAPTPSARQPA